MHRLPLPYFHEDGFTLYHGDCRSILKGIPEGSIDLVFADPPYNLSNGGFTCHAGKRAPVDKGAWDMSHGVADDFQFHRDWISSCGRVLSMSASLWISGTYHSIYMCGYALQLEGFQILNDICWYKPNAPPNLSTRYFTASHETLIWARRKDAPGHVFNYQEMKHGEWNGDLLKVPGKQMRSVWSISSPRRKEKEAGKHPTQKPRTLLRRVITACSGVGDLVLDPFSGSSTTGLEAYSLGRHYIGIEKDESYLELSVRRFQELKKEMNG